MSNASALRLRLKVAKSLDITLSEADPITLMGRYKIELTYGTSELDSWVAAFSFHRPDVDIGMNDCAEGVSTDPAAAVYLCILNALDG